MTAMRLAGLSTAETRMLVEQVTGRSAPKDLIDALQDRTRGNPLAIIQLTRALQKETHDGTGWLPHADHLPVYGPEMAAALFAPRLDVLGPEAFDALTLLCVYGPPAPAALLFAAAEREGATTTTIQQLEAAGLVDIRGR